jgi:cytosine/adenosine deaminase-related metal-dependent hydrolase
VTTVGEIARPDWPIETIAGPLDTLVFLELLGLSPSRVEPLLAAARAHVDRSSDPGSPFQAGLSPHAPYTVHPELLVGACRISRERRVPLAMHLAESGDELELLRSHSGALVETLREFDAWEPAALPRGLTPRDYLEQLAGAWRGLVVHGNFLGAEDWRRLAEMRDRLSVVYCPRTHSRFVPTPYPLAEMLAAGVRMALGTDSRATNPDLDFLAELRWVAANHPAVAPGELLRMATSDAAAALGLSDRGVVDVGRRADFAVMQPPTGPVNNPWEWLNDDRWTIRHVLYAGKPRSMFEKKRFSGAGPG